MRPIALASALLCLATVAQAELRSLPSDVCINRQYDGAHLAKHPEQLVTRISGKIFQDPETQTLFAHIIVTKRGAGPAQVLLLCEQNPQDEKVLNCMVPEQYGGGGMSLELEPEYKVLMRVSTWLVLRDTNNNVVGRLEPGLDDKAFRLDRGNCIAEAN